MFAAAGSEQILRLETASMSAIMRAAVNFYLIKQAAAHLRVITEAAA